jgi:hypothetical protein
MSTAAAPAVADPASTNPSPKPKHEITVTRGGAYLLESIVQSGKVFPDMHKSAKGSKLRRLLREQNPARTDTIDFEKGEVFNTNDQESAKARLAWNEAFNSWRDQKVILFLTPKQRDLAREGLKIAFKKREELGLLPENNDHTESLINGFDLGDDETPEE